VRKANNLPPSCAVVMKYGNLNFLEPSGPLQACNGTALLLPLLVTAVKIICILTSECSNLSIINIFHIFWIFQVTSKPDLYPLVISYGDSGKGGTGGNYLMVQYFRNYIVRPVGKHKTTVTLEMYKIILCKTTVLQNVML